MDGGFREALLRQDGIEPGLLPAPERAKIERLRARDRAAVRWLKVGVIFAWLLTVVTFVASGLEAYVWGHQGEYPAQIETAQTAWQRSPKLLILRVIMPIESVALSAWLYLRTRRLNRRQAQAALLACEAEIRALTGSRRSSTKPSG